MAEHLGRGFAVFAVQAIDGNAQFGVGVALPFDHVVLCVALDAVLRAKERRKLEQLAVVFLEEVEGVVQVREYRSRVEDGAEALALEVSGESLFKTCKLLVISNWSLVFKKIQIKGTWQGPETKKISKMAQNDKMNFLFLG